MRSTLALGALLMVAATMLVDCSSGGEAHEPDGGSTVDANTSDAPVDAAEDGGSTDAATEDEFEVPDGAVVCEASPCAVALAGGIGTNTASAFCTILSDKTVYCWGTAQQNKIGYPGEGDSMMSSRPRRVAGLTNVQSVSIGGENGCATDESGRVYCWGAPELVNAGRDPDAGAPIEGPAQPTLLDLVPAASSVSVGGTGTACVKTKAGGISCWGRSDRGELGRETPDASSPPTEIPLGGGTDFSVWPGDGWMFATPKSGELYSWGAYQCSDRTSCNYMLGRESSEMMDPVPTLVPRLSKVRGVSTGPSHGCAIAGRFVECWGSNRFGRLGRGVVEEVSRLPGRTKLSAAAEADDADAGIAPRLDVPLQVSVDPQQTCVVMGSGRVYCWSGLHADPPPPPGEPVQVEGLSGPAVAVVSGLLANCALLRSGKVECWGSNILGALGRGIDDVVSDPRPAPVVFADE